MRTQAKVRELMTPRNTDVRSSFDVGEVAFLQKRRASQLKQSKTDCSCEDADGRSIEKTDHSVVCNRTLNWIVRVAYTTLYGNVAHMDSVRLCMADAARLRGQYDAHKATVHRVYPLRLR